MPATGTPTPTLTDRYVAAVVRSLPPRQQDDVARELRAAVADQVGGRVEAGEPPVDAERAVLVELGDPDELAARYADRPLWLIGPRYFVPWRRLVVLLLWIVLPCVAFAVALGQTLSDAGLGTTIGTTLGATTTTGLHVVVWTTVVFAVLERSTTTPAEAGIEPWTPDRLPAPESSRALFSEMVATLVLMAVSAGLVVWDQWIGLAYVKGAGYDGEWMPVLDPALWPWWLGGLLAAIVVTAVLAVVAWARGGWSIALATVNAVVAIAVGGGTVWLLAQDRLFDPELVAALTALGAQDLDTVVPVVVGFLVAAAAVWAVVDGFRKAHRADRRTPEPR